MEYTDKAPLIGKAGELRVRAELMFRGISAAVFDFDDGTDIVLSNGIRLQVKTSLKPSYSSKDYSYRYSFSIRMAQFRSIGSNKYKREHTRQKYDVDYFIFYCVKHELFYIVPEKMIGKKVSLVIPTPEDERTYKKHVNKKSTSKYEKYKNNWELLK